MDSLPVIEPFNLYFCCGTCSRAYFYCSCCWLWNSLKVFHPRGRQVNLRSVEACLHKGLSPILGLRRVGHSLSGPSLSLLSNTFLTHAGLKVLSAFCVWMLWTKGRCYLVTMAIQRLSWCDLNYCTYYKRKCNKNEQWLVQDWHINFGNTLVFILTATPDTKHENNNLHSRLLLSMQTLNRHFMCEVMREGGVLLKTESILLTQYHIWNDDMKFNRD